MKLTELLEESVISQIKSLPKEPLEYCGYINKNSELVFLENLAENPQEDFLATTPNVEGIKIFFHTHWEDTSPSFLTAIDIRESKKNNIPYLLYHTVFEEWDYFNPDLIENPYPLIFNKISDLNHLRWEWDRCDCYSIVRMYYKLFLDLEIKDYIRPLNPELLKRNTWDEFSKCLPSRGFYEVFRTPKKHDVVVFLNPQNNNTASHIGVMVSNTHILHHPGIGQTSETRLLEGLEYPIYKVFAHSLVK